MPACLSAQFNQISVSIIQDLVESLNHLGFFYKRNSNLYIETPLKSTRFCHKFFDKEQVSVSSKIIVPLITYRLLKGKVS